jgi:hypothetical protein
MDRYSDSFNDQYSKAGFIARCANHKANFYHDHRDFSLPLFATVNTISSTWNALKIGESGNTMSRRVFCLRMTSAAGGPLLTLACMFLFPPMLTSRYQRAKNVENYADTVRAKFEVVSNTRAQHERVMTNELKTDMFALTIAFESL